MKKTKKKVYMDGFINGVGEFYMHVPSDMYDERSIISMFVSDVESHGVWVNEEIISNISTYRGNGWTPRMNVVCIKAEISISADGVLGVRENNRFTPVKGKITRVVDSARNMSFDICTLHHFQSSEFEYLDKRGCCAFTPVTYCPRRTRFSLRPHRDRRDAFYEHGYGNPEFSAWYSSGE